MVPVRVARAFEEGAVMVKLLSGLCVVGWSAAGAKAGFGTAVWRPPGTGSPRYPSGGEGSRLRRAAKNQARRMTVRALTTTATGTIGHPVRGRAIVCVGGDGTAAAVVVAA